MQRRADVGGVAHERELLQSVDTEEHRRVCRVQDLVPALRELAEHPVQVTLEVRAEVELRLLDEQDEAAEAGAAASSSVQIAVRTVDLPLDASPTSAHTLPGFSSSSRAAR